MRSSVLVILALTWSGWARSAYSQTLPENPAATNPVGNSESMIGLRPKPLPEHLRALVDRSSAMGTSIYLQDKAAWIGTDALYEYKHSHDTSDIGGFLAMSETGDGGTDERSFTVLFLTPGQPPRIKYRVRVQPNAKQEPTVERLDPPGQPDEETLVLLRARQTAAGALTRGTQSFNTVVVPARHGVVGDGIVVYLLASTSAANVAVLGKHYRIVVSSDGKAVKRFEPLSYGALEVPMTPPRPGSQTVALTVSHGITDYPLETHVFASLLNKVPIFVVTRRGAWRVDGSRIDYLGTIERGGKTAPTKASAASPPPTCASICTAILATRCPHGPPNRAECADKCEGFRSGPCAGEFRALFTAPAPRLGTPAMVAVSPPPPAAKRSSTRSSSAVLVRRVRYGSAKTTTVVARLRSRDTFVILMPLHSVRFDDETEEALEQVREATGVSVSAALKHGIVALRDGLAARKTARPYEIYQSLDLGRGGYAQAPARLAKRALGEVIRKKHRR